MGEEEKETFAAWSGTAHNEEQHPADASKFGDHCHHHHNQQLDNSLQERFGVWLGWQHKKHDQAKQGCVWI